MSKSKEELSGLALMKLMQKGDLPLLSIAITFPMKVIKVEKGIVVFEAVADDRHLNPLGGVHGGFAATVLDSALGCAVHTELEKGVGYGTIDLNIKMVRPVPKNTVLLATGNVLNKSKSLAIAEGTLKDKDGKLYAHATATCKLVRLK